MEKSQRKYQRLLRKRIDMTFSEWREKEVITERELYLFLHTLKGTSGTIGLRELSTLCSSQVELLVQESQNNISVESLEGLYDGIKKALDGVGEASIFWVPEKYRNQLDGETVILVIDDDLEFVTFLKELLEVVGAQVVIALNGKRGIEQFHTMRPNFVFADLHLLDMSGFDVLDQIANAAMARHVTMIIMSSENTKENRIISYEKGAMDFITKPIDLEVFLPYVLNRDKMRKVIGKSIVTDGLTGVGNRKYFDDTIRHLAELSNRSGVSFTFVMADLDHFKMVNDLYGHPAGDAVLRTFGEILRSEKREVDYIFRYGGEEFAFLLSGTTAEQAIAFVERVRTKLDAIVFREKEAEFKVTFSAGIATYEGDTDRVISTADQALYEAKRTGRNRTIVFDENKSLTKRKLTIIIVDDEVLVRANLQKELSDWTLPDVDISIQVFSDGPSFLQFHWYNPGEKYIVLLDRMMPGMDGLNVLHHLKRKHINNNVLVSMMTAQTEESDIRAALSLGADDYIVKPFRSEEILARIQLLLHKLFN